MGEGGLRWELRISLAKVTGFRPQKRRQDRRTPYTDSTAALHVLTCHRSVAYSCLHATGGFMGGNRAEILQGTLDLMVLKTLAGMGPLHGYGIARRIEQISDEALQINQGTIYASLVRLMQQGWISGAWGTSENNRKAKFYSITKSGRKQLQAEAENWERIATVVGRVLRAAERG